MAPALLGFFCGCLWFGIYLIGQIAIFWWNKSVKRSDVLVRGVLAAALAGMISAALLPMAEWSAVLMAEVYVLMTVGCLFVLYGPFFYVVHTSLSIETLLLLLKSGGQAPLGELKERFASRRLFEARLHTMMDNGYLVREGQHYAMTPRAENVARLFASVKSLWRLGAGG